MRELGRENVVQYLHETGRLPRDSAAHAELLAWGVSNVVLRISPDSEVDLVLKQSRAQLRTKAEWFSRLERIWREAEIMQILEPLLPPGTVPRVLFEDRENYLFGMQAVDARHTVWKAELLDGRAELEVARRCGALLATIHRTTWNRGDLRDRWSDRAVFDELRLDPFYRFLKKSHPDLDAALMQLIDETLATSHCVVHADFSPKNILLTRCEDAPSNEEPQIALVDYETGHFGDPAFDLGFFLSHLLLKTVRHVECRDAFLALPQQFWAEYRKTCEPDTGRAIEIAAVERRGVRHLAACLLARIDGKSTVDYLSLPQQNLVRQFARACLLNPRETLADVFDDLNRQLGEL